MKNERLVDKFISTLVIEDERPDEGRQRANETRSLVCMRMDASCYVEYKIQGIIPSIRVK